MGVLYTLPRLSELDSQAVGRMHSLLAMKEKHPDEGWASVSWKNIDVSREDTDGKTYKKYPRMNINGQKHRVTSISIKKPCADIAEAYEERKAEFKEDLYEEVIEAQGDDDNDDDDDPQSVADEVIEDNRVDEFVSHHGQTGRAYVDKDILASKFNLSVRKSNVAKKLIEQEADIGE